VERSIEKTSDQAFDAVETADGTVAASDMEELARPTSRPINSEGGESSLAVVRERQRALRLYIFLPLLFLTVGLLGGLRLASSDNGFVFMAPALICLFFAVVLIVLFVRGELIAFDGWFSDDYPISHNISNGVLMLSLFAATVQVFNSVLPETGLPFWVVSFCFAWSLWNNLFAALDNKRLLRSMIALFAFAFVAKYVFLAGLTAPTGDSWLRSMIENPAKETVTWLLELPRYSAGTGYIQFFCLLLYFAGLYMLPKSAR
jgi:hypothetical protein